MAPAPSLGMHVVHLLPREGQREKKRDGEKESNSRQYRLDSVWHCDSRQRSNSAGTEPSNIIRSGAVGLNPRGRPPCHCVQISKSVFCLCYMLIWCNYIVNMLQISSSFLISAALFYDYARFYMCVVYLNIAVPYENSQSRRGMT